MAPVEDLGEIDGVNQWETLLGESENVRDTMIYNIDPVKNNAAIRLGDFKLLVGDPGSDEVLEPPEFDTYLLSRDDQEKHLYHLKDDPTEQNDLKDIFPEQVLLMENILAQYEESMVDPDIAEDDPAGDPSLWGGVWSTGWCEV